MSEITKECFQNTILRAELAALLHDVGKLSWFFIGAGCKHINYENILLQHHIDVTKDKKGNIRTKIYTVWTQKGRRFIYDILKDNGILPLIERDDVA